VRGVLAAAALLALALPSAAAACTATRTVDPRIPTWDSVNHFALGSRVASDGQVETYLEAVDRSSDRVRTGLATRSVQGRPITFAIVGTPRDVARNRLNAIAARARSLRTGTGPAATARHFAARSPAFAWIAGGVHGNEPSGTDADMRLLYELAARRDCANERRLARVITFLLPNQNPDGRAADRRTNANGFDLNRDWFAATQPETAGKLALLARYPPVVFVDQHEESGASFFVPPNADPIHHEISEQALRAIRTVTAPVRAAFAARNLPLASESTYDLFFMGYGDSVTTTLFGAAGMTFEKGGQQPLPEKVDEHFLAADTALTATAAHRETLLRGWAAQWRQARAEGARGTREPNEVLEPGHRVEFPVPAARIRGYVLRADVHGPDAAALVDRLTRVGVDVRRLARPARVAALHAFGGSGTAAATLPAGTFYIPFAQTQKHWIEALLDEESFVPFPYFYDVTSWSNPLLMGLEGGALHSRLPADAKLERVRPGAAAARPAIPAGAPAYAFAGGSEGAAGLATRLLSLGIAVRRVPGDGTFVVPAPVDTRLLAAAARDRRVPVGALAASPAGAVALATPRIAILADPGTTPSPAVPGVQALSSGWARFVLTDGLGLTIDTLTSAELAGGELAGHTALVVPDGAANAGGLSAPALTAIAAWVRGGGRLVAWRTQGLQVAQAAGLTTVRARAGTGQPQVEGISLRTALDTTSPVAWGEEPASFAFDVGDPVFEASPTARVVARYPTTGFFVSGYAVGTGALRGTAAATTEAAGAGTVVLFSFDPAFRAYAEGTERLLANALLMP